MSYRQFEMPPLPQKASDIRPVEIPELGWAEVDGGVSINGQEVQWRLNALLKIIQRQELEIARLKERPTCRCDGDA